MSLVDGNRCNETDPSPVYVPHNSIRSLKSVLRPLRTPYGPPADPLRTPCGPPADPLWTLLRTPCGPPRGPPADPLADKFCPQAIQQTR
eukprot:1191828-Prorocentrum_minimum.AAC.2